MQAHGVRRSHPLGVYDGAPRTLLEGVCCSGAVRRPRTANKSALLLLRCLETPNETLMVRRAPREQIGRLDDYYDYYSVRWLLSGGHRSSTVVVEL